MYAVIRRKDGERFIQHGTFTRTTYPMGDEKCKEVVQFLIAEHLYEDPNELEVTYYTGPEEKLRDQVREIERDHR